MVKLSTQFAYSNHQTKVPRTFELSRPIYIGAITDTDNSRAGDAAGSDRNENESPLE